MSWYLFYVPNGTENVLTTIINPGFSVLKNARTGNVPGSYVGIFGTDAEKTWPIAFVNRNLLVSLRSGTDSLGRAPLESQRGADCEGKEKGMG